MSKNSPSEQHRYVTKHSNSEPHAVTYDTNCALCFWMKIAFHSQAACMSVCTDMSRSVWELPSSSGRAAAQQSLMRRVSNQGELLSDSSKKARLLFPNRGVFSPRMASVKLGRLQAYTMLFRKPWSDTVAAWNKQKPQLVQQKQLCFSHINTPCSSRTYLNHI